MVKKKKKTARHRNTDQTSLRKTSGVYYRATLQPTCKYSNRFWKGTMSSVCCASACLARARQEAT